MFTIKKIWSSDITELIDKHANLDREEIGGSDIIVYKVSIRLVGNLKKNPSNNIQLVQRWPGRAVYLIYFNDGIYDLVEVTRDNLVNRKDNKKLVNDIRNYDLEQLIVKRSKYCAIQAPYGGHFVTPSGKHTKTFIRIADAITSYNSMDRISFWLQEYIKEDLSGIVVDTPSLLSVVVHTFNLLGKSVPFTCINENTFGDDIENKANSILRKFSTRISNEGKILLIISMSVSGETTESVIQALKGAGIRNTVESFSIFALKDSPVASQCKLSINLKWYESKQDCKLCESPINRRLYEIDRKTFFPKLATQKTVVLKVKHAKNIERDNGLEKFYKKYGSQPEIFRFHYSDENDGYNSRHHAFYLHVLSLLQNNGFILEFKKKLKNIINSRGKIDLVVHPPHRAAKKIVEIAKTVQQFKSIESTSLAKSTPLEINDLTTSKHIMILDDVLITGGRQLGYLQNLREIFTNIDFALEHLTFFPLITRPESSEILDRLKRAFMKHDWYNYSETLYSFLLPKWSEDDCPWCKEKKLLTNYVDDPMDEDKWYQKRIEVLSDLSKDGIISDPLLYFDGVERFTMSAGSPIVKKGYCESVVLFVISSALQALREDKDDPLGNTLLFQNLLSFESIDQYSDPLIQACLLKATSVEEWANEFYDDLYSKGIYELFKNPDARVLPELMIKAFDNGRRIGFGKKFLESYKKHRNSLSVSQLLAKLES